MINWGTGFVVRRGDVLYLVTALHVLTRGSYLPPERTGDGVDRDMFLKVRHSSLWNDADRSLDARRVDLWSNSSPRWAEISSGGHTMDLTAIRLADTDWIPPEAILSTIADETPHHERGSRLWVPGYPKGRFVGKGHPIWMTAFAAADSDLSYEGRPTFLLDVSGAPGLSGAPTFDFDALEAEEMKLVGVYTGRLDESVPVGLAWTLSALHQLLDAADNC